MSEEEKKNTSLVSSSSKSLVTRSSGLAKRGLQLLSSQKDRTIYFPTDRSIGVLYVLGEDNKWIKIDARGKVIVPVARSLRFDGTPTAGLSQEERAFYSILGTYEELKTKIIEITDSDLVYLQKLYDLKWLNLSGSNITDAGLSNLPELPELETLYLSGTYITGTGLICLQGSNKLR